MELLIALALMVMNLRIGSLTWNSLHKDCIKFSCGEDPYLSQMTTLVLMLTNVSKMTIMIVTFLASAQTKLDLIHANVKKDLMAMDSTALRLMSAIPAITTVMPTQHAVTLLAVSTVHVTKVTMVMVGNALMVMNVLKVIAPETSTESMTHIMTPLIATKMPDVQMLLVASTVLATKATMVTALSVKIKMNVAKLTVPVKLMDSMKHFLPLMNATKSPPVSTKLAITIVLAMMATMVTDSTVMMLMNVMVIMNVTKMLLVTILLADIIVHAYPVTLEVDLNVLTLMSVIQGTTIATKMHFAII